MEIEKTLNFDAPPERVWALLLDPVAMGACVPGMESIDVLSETEYVAVMKVKISFISARFKLKTRIVESDAPRYLRAEGTGEDASVASSLKQVSEMWLTQSESGGTTLRMKVVVDVLGRMGSFGLGVMKTKADRLWDEFGVNAAARLAEGPPSAAHATSAAPVSPPLGPPEAQTAMPKATASATPLSSTTAPMPSEPPKHPVAPHAAVAGITMPATDGLGAQTPGFWARLFGARQDIRVELTRGDLHLRVHWPVQAAPACVSWLNAVMASGTDAPKSA